MGLTFLMMFTLLPAPAFADENDGGIVLTEEYGCTCQEPCAEDAIDEDCDVCAADYAECFRLDEENIGSEENFPEEVPEIMPMSADSATKTAIETWASNNGITGLIVTDTDTDIVTVTGTASQAAAGALDLTIPAGVTVDWQAELTGSDTEVISINPSSGVDSVFQVSGSASLTSTAASGANHVIYNDSSEAEVKITGGTITGGAGSNSYTVRNYSTGTVTISGGTINGGSGTGNYGIHNADAGTVTITDGEINGGSGTYSYGVRNAADGTVIISGGTINGGSGSTSSYGVENSDNTGTIALSGTAVINGGTGTTSNGLYNSSGPITIAPGADITVTAGAAAIFTAAALTATSGGTVTVTGGSSSSDSYPLTWQINAYKTGSGSLAKYAKIGAYVPHTLSYADGGATGGTEPTDVTAASTVLADEGTLYKAGSLFAGWKAADGTTYYPGETFTIADDSILTAQWVPDTASRWRTSTLNLNDAATIALGKNDAEGWAWDNTSKILTLKNAHIEAASGCGIRLPSDATILLIGNNYVKSGSPISGTSYGIETSTATIKGFGSLTALGGTFDITGMGGYSAGIFIYTALTIESGRVIATGGEITTNTGTAESKGIGASVMGCNVTIKGGTVTATGGGASGGASNNSYGIYAASGTITLSGGVVIARSGTAATNSNAMNTQPKDSGGTSISTAAAGTYSGKYAVYGAGLKTAVTTAPTFSTGGTASGNGYAWANGTLTLTGANFNTGGAAAISLPDGATIVLEGVNVVKGGDNSANDGTASGISCIGSLTIEGAGSLIAIAGSSSGGGDSESCGIFVNQALTIDSGSVTAIGGTSKIISSGIDALGSLSVGGGKVTSIGGSSNFDSYGVYDSDVTVSRGSLNAIGGTAAEWSQGICGYNVTVTGGNFAAVGGTVTDDDGYSAGIFQSGKFLMTGGKAFLAGSGDVLYADNAFSDAEIDISAVSILWPSGGQVVPDEYYDDGSCFLADSNGDLLTHAVLGTASTTYTVTYSKNGGDKEASPSSKSGISSGGNVGSLPTAPTRAGYTFAGWNTKADGTGTTFTASTAVTADITVYAKWTAIGSAYTITFNANGGSVATVSAATDISGKLSTLPIPTHSGYTFSGWFTELSGGTKITTSTVFTADATVYAQWTVNSPSGGGGGGGGGGTPAPAPETPSSNVLVDGKEVDAGKTEVKNGTTTVTVNQETIQKQLETATSNVTVVVPAETGTAVAQLVVQNVDDMAAKDISLTIQVGNVQYEIPTAAIDTSSVLAALGADNAADVPISITITTDMSAAAQEAVDKAIASSGGELVIPPMEFKITAAYNGQSVEISVFSQYVSRSVEITAEQAAKITTAIVVDPDGTTRQVPTNVYQKDGKWYAEVSSLTNSTYALIYNELSFADAADRWYEAAVNEMGSRKIISGIGNGKFAGERDITRAEFAAILVRALGLPATGNGAVFSDVSRSAWYCGAVGTAHEYGLVSGVGNNNFAPDKKITRREAMLMIQRMAKVAGFTGGTGSIETFSDISDVSGWAPDAATWNVGSGLIVGSNGKLNPSNNITRAETATLVLKLMQKAKLVEIRTKF